MLSLSTAVAADAEGAGAGVTTAEGAVADLAGGELASGGAVLLVAAPGALPCGAVERPQPR